MFDVSMLKKYFKFDDKVISEENKVKERKCEEVKENKENIGKSFTKANKL